MPELLRVYGVRLPRFTFRARVVRNKHGRVFSDFGRADSKNAMRKMSEAVRSAAAPPRLPVREGPGTMAQPDRVGMDQLLRPPSTSQNCIRYSGQRLPGALDEEEVQTAADLQYSPRRLEAHNPAVPTLPIKLATGPEF